jgi:syndecan 4
VYSTNGASTSACDGPCDAGYFCAPGSVNRQPAQCAAGQYSEAGSSTCSNCPVGKYGATAGLPTSACSGNCDPGYLCPAASTVSNPPGAQCPAGRYALAGATACSPCDAGYYGASTGATTSACDGACVIAVAG